MMMMMMMMIADISKREKRGKTYIHLNGGSKATNRKQQQQSHDLRFAIQKKEQIQKRSSVLHSFSRLEISAIIIIIIIIIDNIIQSIIT